MKGYFRFSTTSAFRFSKRLFLAVFVVAFFVQGTENAFADKYDNWKTLFGPTNQKPGKEELRTRERSGIWHKGVRSQNSIITSINTIGGIPGVSGTGIPTGGTGNQTPIPQVPQNTPPTVLGIRDFDLYVSLNKTLQWLTNPIPQDSTPRQKAEYAFNMIADEDGGTPNSNGGRDRDAFIIRTIYTTVEGKQSTIYTTVPNIQDNQTRRVVDGTSLVIDYGENSREIEKQSVISTVIFGTGTTAAKPGSTAISDFWYCAGVLETDDVWTNWAGLPVWIPVANIDGTDAPNEDTPEGRVQRFPGKCGGTAYYKIGDSISYTLPATIEAATQQQQENADLVSGANARAGSENLPTCHLLNGNGPGEGTLAGCFAQFFYWVIFTPISFIAALLGKLFDFFLAYSLSDESYRAGSIITEGWKVVRDLSNIFFIVIMIYTGLAAVFSTGNTSYKKVVPSLIVNALLINFSLFFTQIVIDTSNVIARLFYNQMTVTVDGSASTVDPKPISEAIVSSFNPQKIFDGVLQKEIVVPTQEQQTAGAERVSWNSQADYGQQDGGWSTESSDYAQFFIIVTIMAALIMWGVAMMFWKTAFLFVGRVVQFYISMIFSPFAFLSRGGVPLVSKIPQLNYDSWWDDLFKTAVLAPVFLFFLLVVNKFMGTRFFNSIQELNAGNGFVDTALKIVIPLLIVYGMISYGVAVAKKFSTTVSGLVSDKITGIANKAAGLAGGVALGVATGGAALAGRSVLARSARGLQQNTRLGNWIQRNQSNKVFGRLARGANQTLTGAQTASYDFQKTGVFSKLKDITAKDLGVKLQTDNAVLNTLSLGSKNFEGGLKGYEKRKGEKETKEKIESLETNFKTDDQAKTFYADAQTREFIKEKAPEMESSTVKDKLSRMRDKDLNIFKKEAEQELQNKKNNGLIATFSMEDIARVAKDNKERWEKANASFVNSFVDFEKEQQKKYGFVKDNETLTQAMRLRYADKLKEDSSTLWNTIRAIAIPGIGIIDAVNETKLKESGAKKYGEKTRKEFTKNQKAIEAEEKISETINTIIADTYEKLTDELKTAVDGTKKGEEFNHKDLSDEERDRVLREYRKKVDVDIQLHQEELDRLKELYKKNPLENKEEYRKAQTKMAELKENKEEAKNIAARYRSAAEKVEKIKGEKNEKQENKPKEEPKN